MGKKTVSSARPIKTTFYQGRKIVRVNNSKRANNAVPNAIRHMQVGQYDATHCEVFDSVSGELHAVIRRHIGANSIVILFKREVKGGF